MAVSKFYAKWKKSSGEEELVNAFDALALKGRALIETSPKAVLSIRQNLMPLSRPSNQSKSFRLAMASVPPLFFLKPSLP